MLNSLEIRTTVTLVSSAHDHFQISRKHWIFKTQSNKLPAYRCCFECLNTNLRLLRTTRINGWLFAITSVTSYLLSSRQTKVGRVRARTGSSRDILFTARSKLRCRQRIFLLDQWWVSSASLLRFLFLAWSHFTPQLPLTLSPVVLPVPSCEQTTFLLWRWHGSRGTTCARR